MITTPSDIAQRPEFIALEECAALIDNLQNEALQRQVMAFLAERYGFNLQPTVKVIRSYGTKPSPKRRGY